MSAALESNAPIVREELSSNLCFDWELGNLNNTENALDKSHHITTIELTNNRLAPNPIECRSTIGQYNKKLDCFNLYCCNSGPIRVVIFF